MPPLVVSPKWHAYVVHQLGTAGHFAPYVRAACGLSSGTIQESITFLRLDTAPSIDRRSHPVAYLSHGLGHHQNTAGTAKYKNLVHDRA